MPTRSGILVGLQLHEGGEHGTKQVMGRVRPVIAEWVEVAGFNAGIHV